MDEWPTCKYCGCVTMMIEVDRGYCSNFLCKADHLKAVESHLSAAEREMDDWKRSSELVARVLIDTKADLAAARVVVEAVKAWKKASWPGGIDEAWEDIGKALAEYDKVKP